MSNTKYFQIDGSQLTKTNCIERFLTQSELQGIIDYCKYQILSYELDGITELDIYKMNRDLLAEEINKISKMIDINENISAKVNNK
jgi:hypothetical protein